MGEKSFGWETLNMKKVLILVEGQTEERFVKTVLYKYFASNEIQLVPTILSTKEVKDGPNFKGGVVSYGKVKKHIANLLKDTSCSMITTMFDYYGLPGDFPGYHDKPNNVTCYKKVDIMEAAFAKDINNIKFLPYLQLHEFEALLFSSPNKINDTFPSPRDNLAVLEGIKNSFTSPEEINEVPETCPSRRLLKIYPRYVKPVYGPMISSGIGIDTIRKECPHFNQWIEKMLNC